jgi:hypothetical protein
MEKNKTNKFDVPYYRYIKKLYLKVYVNDIENESELFKYRPRSAAVFKEVDLKIDNAVKGFQDAVKRHDGDIAALAQPGEDVAFKLFTMLSMISSNRNQMESNHLMRANLEITPNTEKTFNKKQLTLLEHHFISLSHSSKSKRHLLLMHYCIMYSYSLTFSSITYDIR